MGEFTLPAAAQHDIGTTTGHVGGYGYCGSLTRIGHNIRFHGVEFGVQNLVFDPCLGQLTGNHFGFFNRDGPHQHRLAVGSPFTNIFNDRRDLLFFGHVDQIRHIFTDHWAVGRHHDGIELVDGAEFEGFGVRRTGHTGQLLIETEVVLEGDRSQRLVFVLDLYAFFGFYRLVQTIGPAAALHGTAGMFVNDNDFTVFNDIVNVAGEQHVGTQRGGDVVHQHDVGW
ncbi:hypothetical protein D3C79_612060 [compost metagenome]